MSLRDTLERIRSNPPPGNEEMAKFQVLAPILADLSWDPFGQEVRWEHPVGGKKSKGWADIALKAGDHIWALVEAKAPGTNLNHHVEQVLGYAFFEGVSICVLTDGLCWWLYLPREPGPPEKRRFAELELAKDPLDQVCDDLEAFLGRESLVSGRTETRATQVLRARTEAAQLAKEMPPIWRRMLDEPDNELVELVGQRVYKELSLRPERDQILAVIREMPLPTPKPAMPVPADKPQAAKTQGSAPPEKRAAQRKAQRPVAVLLLGERHPVRSHVEVLTTVVEELHRRHPHDFDQAVETLKAGEWQYVSRDHKRVYGPRIRQTATGHYVNVNLSARNIRKRVVRLMETLDYRESDLVYVYE